MKTLFVLFAMVFGLGFTGGAAFAQGGATQAIEAKLEGKSETRSSERSRRKKVEMCQECGKPETECECEGHGEEEAHEHEEE